MRNIVRRLVFFFLMIPATAVALELPWPGTDLEGRPCSGTRNDTFGYDYTDEHLKKEHKYKMVVNAHFKPEVENLTDNNLWGNLNYTLNASPNHHRALWAMIRLQLRYEQRQEGRNVLQLPGYWRHIPAPECYLNRAVLFSPKDATLHVLQGIYLHKRDLLDPALQAYQQAIKKGLDTAELHYNLGLLYVDLGDIAAAERHAEKAYSQGYPTPGLQRKIQRMKSDRDT